MLIILSYSNVYTMLHFLRKCCSSIVTLECYKEKIQQSQVCPRAVLVYYQQTRPLDSTEWIQRSEKTRVRSSYPHFPEAFQFF
jgi:hypothetical protein